MDELYPLFIRKIAPHAVKGIRRIGDQSPSVERLADPLDEPLLGILRIDGKQHVSFIFPRTLFCQPILNQRSRHADQQCLDTFLTPFRTRSGKFSKRLYP